jgi:type II secretory pathway pseudopilin PulG
MIIKNHSLRHEAGFSFIELLAVICCIVIIAGLGLPIVTTVTDGYSLLLAAQQITTQLQSARMKAVTNNESIRVRFDVAQKSYQIETSDGSRLSGPFGFAPGIMYNETDSSPAVTFAGMYAEFLPGGNLPRDGNGSAGRVKIRNRSSIRIDILVNSNGMVRATPTFKTSSPPF